MTFAQFFSGLGGIAVASGAGAASVHLLGQLLKYLIGLLQAKAKSPTEELALKGVETAVEVGVGAAEAALKPK